MSVSSADAHVQQPQPQQPRLVTQVKQHPVTMSLMTPPSDTLASAPRMQQRQRARALSGGSRSGGPLTGLSNGRPLYSPAMSLSDAAGVMNTPLAPLLDSAAGGGDGEGSARRLEHAGALEQRLGAPERGRNAAAADVSNYWRKKQAKNDQEQRALAVKREEASSAIGTAAADFDGTASFSTSASTNVVSSPASPMPRTVPSRYVGGIAGAYSAAVRRKLLVARFGEVVVFLAQQAGHRLCAQQVTLEFLLSDGAATRDSERPTAATLRALHRRSMRLARRDPLLDDNDKEDHNDDDAADVDADGSDAQQAAAARQQQPARRPVVSFGEAATDNGRRGVSSGEEFINTGILPDGRIDGKATPGDLSEGIHNAAQLQEVLLNLHGRKSPRENQAPDEENAKSTENKDNRNNTDNCTDDDTGDSEDANDGNHMTPAHDDDDTAAAFTGNGFCADELSLSPPVEEDEEQQLLRRLHRLLHLNDNDDVSGHRSPQRDASNSASSVDSQSQWLDQQLHQRHQQDRLMSQANNGANTQHSSAASASRQQQQLHRLQRSAGANRIISGRADPVRTTTSGITTSGARSSQQQQRDRRYVVDIIQRQIEELHVQRCTLAELADEMADHRGLLSDRFVARMLQISHLVASSSWCTVPRTAFCTPVDPWSQLSELVAPELLQLLLDTTSLVPAGDSTVSQQAIREGAISDRDRFSRAASETGGASVAGSFKDSAAGMRSGVAGAPTASAASAESEVLPVRLEAKFARPENVSEVDFKRMLGERMRDLVNYAHLDGHLEHLGVFNLKGSDKAARRAGIMQPPEHPAVSANRSPPPGSASSAAADGSSDGGDGSDATGGVPSVAFPETAPAPSLMTEEQAHEVQKALLQAKERARGLRQQLEAKRAAAAAASGAYTDPSADMMMRAAQKEEQELQATKELQQQQGGSSASAAATALEAFMQQMGRLEATAAANNVAGGGAGAAVADAVSLDFTQLFDFDGTRGELAMQHAKMSQAHAEAEKASAWGKQCPLHDQVALWFAVLKRVAPQMSISALCAGLWDEGSNIFDNPRAQYRAALPPEQVTEAARVPDGRLPPYYYFGTAHGDVVGVPSAFVLSPDGEDFHPGKIRAAIAEARRRREEQKRADEEARRRRLLEEEQQIYEALVLARQRAEMARKKKKQQPLTGGGGGSVGGFRTLTPAQQAAAKKEAERLKKKEREGLLPDGRRASLVEQARKLMAERHAGVAFAAGSSAAAAAAAFSSSAMSGGAFSSAGAASSASLSGGAENQPPPPLPHSNTNNTGGGDKRRPASPPSSKRSGAGGRNNNSINQKGGAGGGAASGDGPASQGDDDEALLSATTTASTKRPRAKGILAALAAAYSNIERMSREAMTPAQDPTRRRDTLSELFPCIRIFTGHDGFPVRSLQATRSVTLGAVLVSCADDKVIRVARTSTQELLLVIPGAFAVSCGIHLEFFTDRVLSVHMDGVMRMWDITADPPRPTQLLACQLLSYQRKLRMEDTAGQTLYHEAFHGGFQRNRYQQHHHQQQNSASAGEIEGVGRGSLMLRASKVPQQSLRELLKDAPGIAELARAGLRTSIGEPAGGGGGGAGGGGAVSGATRSFTAAALGKSDAQVTQQANIEAERQRLLAAAEAKANRKQFVHRIAITSIAWAAETRPSCPLPEPSMRGKYPQQVFAVGTALGHIYVCRWSLDSSKTDEGDGEDDDDNKEEDKQQQQQQQEEDGEKYRAWNSAAKEKAPVGMMMAAALRNSGDNDDGDDDQEKQTASAEASDDAVSRHSTDAAGAPPIIVRPRSVSAVSSASSAAAVSSKGGAGGLLLGADISSTLKRRNSSASLQAPTTVLQRKTSSVGPTAPAAATSTTASASVPGLSTAQPRLMSSQSRIAASNLRMLRQKMRDKDAESAHAVPVMALMPSPFDAPLVSMNAWNINHLDRPNLNTDESVGGGSVFGCGGAAGEPNCELPPMQQARLLEAVDAAASEKMAKLREAVAAEDRAAAREALRRKTAGVGGDPQTNGGAPIPGHTCAVTALCMPGSNILFSGDDRGVLLMWDCRGAFATDAAVFRRPRKRFQYGHVDAVTSIAATSDGLLVSGSRDALVIVWSWIDGVLLHRINHHHHVVTGVTLAAFVDPELERKEREAEQQQRQLREQQPQPQHSGDRRGSEASNSSGVSHSAASHTASARSGMSNMSSACNTTTSSSSYKPWPGGVTVRGSAAQHKKVLLITSSLDETLQSFELSMDGLQLQQPLVRSVPPLMHSSRRGGVTREDSTNTAESARDLQQHQQQQCWRSESFASSVGGVSARTEEFLSTTAGGSSNRFK